MNRHRLPILLAISAALAAAAAPASASAASVSSAKAKSGSSKHSTKHSTKHKKTKKVAVGPSLSVIGFGIDRLYVANGAKVTSAAKCSEMVDGNGGPVGPPQQVDYDVLSRATAIPADAPTRIAGTFSGPLEELSDPTLSQPADWSVVAAKGPGLFAAPPGSRADLFNTLLTGNLAQFGENEGPSAEEFDGDYSYTISVEVGGHTLTSTASVKVECPLLR
jgi:hypothetical protein